MYKKKKKLIISNFFSISYSFFRNRSSSSILLIGWILLTLCTFGCCNEGATGEAAFASFASSSLVTTPRILSTTEMVFQRFAIEPMDQTAVIGSRVTLPCRVLDQKGPIQWTKDDFGLGAVRNLTGYDRYAMIGSDEEGESIFYYHILFLRFIFSFLLYSLLLITVSLIRT